MKRIVVGAVLLSLLVAGCIEDEVRNPNEVEIKNVTVSTESMPFYSAENVRIAALNNKANSYILVMTDEKEGAVWMLQDADNHNKLSIIRNTPEATLFEIDEISVSPDDEYLAVVSRGEGHPLLEIFELSVILASDGKEGKVSRIAYIDPYPGEIGINGWQGRSIKLWGTIPLDKIDKESREVTGDVRIKLLTEGDLSQEEKYLWEIETDRIIKLVE